MTEWLDRPGIDDWEKSTKTIWKNQMDSTSDDFFDSCQNAKIFKDDIPQNLSIEFLGYHARDNIRIDDVHLSFKSPTWIGQPLNYEILDFGWTGTNYESYEDGGVHAVRNSTLKNPGWYKF